MLCIKTRILTLLRFSFILPLVHMDNENRDKQIRTSFVLGQDLLTKCDKHLTLLVKREKPKNSMLLLPWQGRKNSNNSLISCPTTRDWKLFQSLVLSCGCYCPGNKWFAQGQENRDKGKNRDKRLKKLKIRTSTTSNSHGTLGQENRDKTRSLSSCEPRLNIFRLSAKCISKDI